MGGDQAGPGLGHLPCPRASRHQSPVGLERVLVASRARPAARPFPGLFLRPESPFPHHLQSPLLAFDSPGYHLLQAGSLTPTHKVPASTWVPPHPQVLGPQRPQGWSLGIPAGWEGE